MTLNSPSKLQRNSLLLGIGLVLGFAAGVVAVSRRPDTPPPARPAERDTAKARARSDSLQRSAAERSALFEELTRDDH